jgi:hypothetical protein
MRITPKIIVTSFNNKTNQTEPLARVINLVHKSFDEMGIKIISPPQDFTLKDLSKWTKEQTNKEDFLINVEEDTFLQINYKSENEKELSLRWQKLLSNLTDTESNNSKILDSKENELFETLTNLPLHTWNIALPNHLSNKEQSFSIMACITDLYTKKHNLITEDKIWPFRDVTSSHFAFQSIKKAKEKKIITGYKGDIFNPNGGITRGEVLYMLDKLGLLE